MSLVFKNVDTLISWTFLLNISPYLYILIKYLISLFQYTPFWGMLKGFSVHSFLMTVKQFILILSQTFIFTSEHIIFIMHHHCTFWAQSLHTIIVLLVTPSLHTLIVLSVYIFIIQVHFFLKAYPHFRARLHLCVYMWKERDQLNFKFWTIKSKYRQSCL